MNSCSLWQRKTLEKNLGSTGRGPLTLTDNSNPLGPANTLLCPSRSVPMHTVTCVHVCVCARVYTLACPVVHPYQDKDEYLCLHVYKWDHIIPCVYTRTHTHTHHVYQIIPCIICDLTSHLIYLPHFHFYFSSQISHILSNISTLIVKRRTVKDKNRKPL